MMETIENLVLKRGSHRTREDGMCAMEAVAYIAGEPHGDHPECACPVITRFLITWNDALPDDEARTRLIAPLVPLVVGTRSTLGVESRRSYMALDWLVRVHAPAWMDLTPSLAGAAATLRALPEIVDAATAEAALGDIRSARAASWAAAGDAARAAAGAASWDAAGDAARDAARAAAGAAAGDVARDAARSAAGAASWDALAPTVATLQASAQDIVRRMCAVDGEVT